MYLVELSISVTLFDPHNSHVRVESIFILILFINKNITERLDGLAFVLQVVNLEGRSRPFLVFSFYFIPLLSTYNPISPHSSPSLHMSIW